MGRARGSPRIPPDPMTPEGLVLSLRASLLVWAVGSFIAVGRLAFFFAPRILSFRVNDPTEAAAILAFLTTPVVPTKVEAHE